MKTEKALSSDEQDPLAIRYDSKLPRWTFRVFRKPFKRLVRAVINRAYERGIFGSNQLHLMYAMIDRSFK